VNPSSGSVVDSWSGSFAFLREIDISPIPLRRLPAPSFAGNSYDLPKPRSTFRPRGNVFIPTCTAWLVSSTRWKTRLRDPLRSQTLPYSCCSPREFPIRFVHLHPHKPHQQHVVLYLSISDAFTGSPKRNLQQQRPQQPSGAIDGRPTSESTSRTSRHLLHDLSTSCGSVPTDDPREHASLGNELNIPSLQVNRRRVIHSAAPFAFLHSDDSLRLKFCGRFFNELQLLLQSIW